MVMGNRGGAFHRPIGRWARAAGPPGSGSAACSNSTAAIARSCSPAATPSCSSSTRRPRSPPAIGPAASAAARTPSGSPSVGARPGLAAPARGRDGRGAARRAHRPQRRQAYLSRALDGLPGGAFVRWRGDAPRPISLLADRLLPGRRRATARPSSGRAPARVEVLTPPSIVAVLSAGYRPMLHPTAAGAERRRDGRWKRP